MKPQTGATYKGKDHAKMLVVAEPKSFKTTTLIAQALGVHPGQTRPIVSHPRHLHVLTFDASALGGIQLFLTKSCRAPASALDFRVWNFETEADAVSLEDEPNQTGLFLAVHRLLMKIGDEYRKRPSGVVGVLVFSSLTIFAQALLRSVVGGTSGAGMVRSDPDKWGNYGRCLADIRRTAHDLPMHVIWESHVYKDIPIMAASGEDRPRERLSLQGFEGKNWDANVAQVLRLRRASGYIPNTKLVPIYYDTEARSDAITGGRGYADCLDQKERDLTTIFRKLRLRLPEANPVAKETKT